MGLDAFYQAIPEDCQMFRLSQHDAFYAESLTSIRSYISMSLKASIPEFILKNVPRATELVDMAKEMAITHPGIQTRELLWGRHWDMVHYLLSPARRENREPSNKSEEIIEKAILGSTPLPLNAQSHIRFVWANEVIEIANYLSGISLESLHRFMSKTDMEEKSVYKSSQLLSDNDAQFEILKQDIADLRDFYILVAKYTEGIVTFLG